MIPLPLADRRNLATLERLAPELTRQCFFLRQNYGERGNPMELQRWCMIARRLRLMLRVAEAGERRYERDYRARQVQP